jgi:beta-glucosidase
MQRRQILQSTLALAGAILTGRASRVRALSQLGSDAIEAPVEFPSGFRWGAASSSYQTEGAVHEDGRGESVWDRFSHTPGVVKNGDNGDIACDSYHRYKEDAALMRQLNLNAYRYSIAWPRIQPNGSGPPNQKGLDHYKRVTDAILEANVRPLVTLYHWDIPQALVDKGGWANRDMVARFTEYAGIMAHALADRVGQWGLFNEHKAATGFGYLPLYNEPCGNDPYKFLKATHVINLAQGESFRLLKSISPALRVGSMYDLSPMYPASDSVADQAAAERFHRLQNLWFLKTPLTGQYPEGVLPPERMHELLGFRDGDEARVRAELDYIGVNYYSRFFVHDAPEFQSIPGLNARPVWGATEARDRTDYGWEVYPQGLYEILHTIAREIGHRSIEVTENGAAYNTAPDASGRISDVKRVEFLRSHLRQVARAIKDGLPIESYYCWSLMDNFEWTAGYSQRFGLVYVDYAANCKRTIKESGHWYARTAAANKLV